MEVIDLRGIQCPLNYVKAKIFLETLAPFNELKVIVDKGEAVESVPNSLKSDGYQVLEISEYEDACQIIVQNK